jgi:hypothetical protein
LGRLAVRSYQSLKKGRQLTALASFFARAALLSDGKHLIWSHRRSQERDR